MLGQAVSLDDTITGLLWVHESQLGIISTTPRSFNANLPDIRGAGSRKKEILTPRTEPMTSRLLSDHGTNLKVALPGLQTEAFFWRKIPRY